MRVLGTSWAIAGIILIGCLLSTPVATQSAVRFEQLSASQDFSQSITYQLAQDSFGNVWMATEEGVVRFNSQHSYRYHTNGGLPEEFGGRIRCIFHDRKGTIWIGAERGVARYDPTSDTFVAEISPLDGPVLIRALAMDANGQLWIGAYNGLWRLGTDAKEGEITKVANISGIECLYTDSDNRVLVGSRSGIHIIDPTDGSLRHLPETGTKLDGVMSILEEGNDYLLGSRSQGLWLLGRQTQHLRPAAQDLGNRPVTSLQSNGRGGIYAGTDGNGLYEIGSNDQLLSHYENNVNESFTLSSNGIYDLLRDHEGMLWVATYGGGINRLNPVKNTFGHLTHPPNSRQGLAHPFTRSILEDEDGRIWFGSKSGISVWDPSDGSWQQLLTGTNGRDAPIVMTMTENSVAVFAGTYDQGLFRIEKRSLETKSMDLEEDNDGRIYATATDAAGSLWVGGINREVESIDGRGNVISYPVTQVKSIIPAAAGGVWVAGRSGVSRIKNAKVTNLEVVSPGQLKNGYTTVNALLERENGDLLLATNGGGLVIYTPSSGKVDQLSAGDGLPGDIIQGILPQSGDTVWLSSTQGLIQVDLSTLTVRRVVTEADGLLDTEFNYGSFFRLRSGELLFGGPTGVTRFAPATAQPTNDRPKVVFEAFYLANDRIVPGQPPLTAHPNLSPDIILTYDQNSFALEFAGVLQTTPARVRYRYRLDGFNDGWTESGNQDRVNFTNLDPGSYAFRVQASASAGAWGDERRIAITIAPPWWRTSIAYFCYFLLFAAGIRVLIRIFRLSIKKRNADRRIAFFNNIAHELKTPLAILLASLDNITKDDAASSERARDKVKSTAKRLNALFDQLLNFHKATTVGRSKHPTVLMDVSTHVAELTASFTPLLEEQSLNVTIEEDNLPGRFYYNRDDFDKIFLNVLSNAVKYSRPGGQIRIHLAGRDGENLKVEVTDNGIGIPRDQQKFILREYYRARNAVNSQVSGTGLGLMMVKSLVEREGGAISFESIENQGTTFSLLLVSHPERELAMRPSPAPQPMNASPEGGEQSKILVVEDNDELRDNLCTSLRAEYSVFAAANGKEGLEIAGEIYPDLIITDLIMPEMDGMEMAAAIQEDIKLSHIPVFMLTVLHNREQKVTSIERGISEYLEKPVDLNLLKAKIAGTLDWRKRMRSRYARQTEIQKADEHRNNREDKFINELEQHVLEQIENEQFGVLELCQFAGMSRTSLYMKLKNLVDMSPRDFINHVRLKLARKLLTETADAIKEVAYRCGFTNPKYFSTTFKKKFGMSPRQFQKELKV